MSCVWLGLAKKLKLKHKPQALFSSIKERNVQTPNILCNGEKLTEQQMDENYERINNLKYVDVVDGYDCSTCDPLLFLVAQLYDINIVHNFGKIKILYTHNNDDIKSKKGKNKKKATIMVCSDTEHFW